MRNLIRRIANVLTGNRRGKVILSIPKNPAEFTDEEWFEEYARKNEEALKRGEDVNSAAYCPWPDCNGHMLSGPEGGMSINIKCDICERRWNLTPILRRMERL